MALKDQISSEVGYPAAVGVLVVVCTVALLFFWSHRRSFHVSLKSGSGTKYVREGGDRVRRSTRAHKNVTRWSPDDLSSPTGMAGTPGGKSFVESPLGAVKEAVKTPIAALADTPVAPPTKRGPGRPPKSPKVGELVKEVVTPMRRTRASKAPAS